jgi:hypothetical protein
VPDTALAATAAAERPRVDVAALNFALSAVMAHRKLSARQVAAETGVVEPVLSNLRKHGTCPSAHNLLALLAWLNIPPATFTLPVDPPPPRPRAVA